MVSKVTDRLPLWERPRVLVVTLAICAVVVAGVFGTLGFDIGRSMTRPVLVQIVPSPSR